ncbi:hypothetical protein HDU98_006843 [Podochytrium sp. JEL0797]|nr:hypothetical protein HDU98_006843 [Podochytrium sp. JEL0797]
MLRTLRPHSPPHSVQRLVLRGFSSSRPHFVFHEDDIASASPSASHGVAQLVDSAAEFVGLPKPNGFTQSGVTLAVIGAAAAVLRLATGALWSYAERKLIVKVEIDGKDESYNWLLAWMADQDFVRKSTRFSVLVAPSAGRASTANPELDDELAHMPNYSFLPSPNCTHWFWYRNRIMWLTRTRPKATNATMANSTVLGECIEISTLGFNLWMSVIPASLRTRDPAILPRSKHAQSLSGTLHTPTAITTIPISPARQSLEHLVSEARRKFAERDLKRTVIYSADQYGNWRRTRSRPIRPLSTIVLDGSTKSTVLADAFEFLGNEKWYADRGIPYRRGYMFYGYPGTGKTSFVTALAGELKLNIYVISLANKGLTDETLTELMVDTPPRCILLLEDIDAAFVSRTGAMGPVVSSSPLSPPSRASTPDPTSTGTIVTNVTFSGLLNAIDGVAAQEGRMLIMTTNHIEKLDAALIRPGRVDVKVLFDKATQAQVRDLFIQFFTKPPVPPASPVDTLSPTNLLDDNTNTVLTNQLQQEEQDPHALHALAVEFSHRVPEKGVSMAAVQGHLMRFKQSPEEAVKEVDAFVEAVMGGIPRGSQLN